MSNVYATEPATTGRVIFETTHGPIDIRLWSKECPLTTKLFLQLCLDGYYDNMLFHRIVPGLLIQTGAVRNNQTKNMDAKYREAVKANEALERRQYETNARIRFNHRGQVAMALGIESDGDDEALQPQFFITIEEASYLDSKHVVFGTLGAGPTIFNAIRIANTEVDEATNRPADLEHAPRIVSTKIVENPVHDSIIPQEYLPWKVIESKPEKKKKKRKGKFDTNVLSFGDEMDDVGPVTVKKRKSNSEDKKSSKSKDSVLDSNESNQRKKQEIETVEPKPPPRVPYVSTEATLPKVHKKQSEPPAKRLETKESKPPKKKKISIIEERRAKFAKTKKSKKEREADTLAKLSAFKGKLRNNNGSKTSSESAFVDNSLASRMARRAAQDAESKSDQVEEGVSYHGQILESDGEDDTDNKWLNTKFKCRKHIDHSVGGDGRKLDEYEVIDGQGNVEGSKHRPREHHKKHHRKNGEGRKKHRRDDR